VVAAGIAAAGGVLAPSVAAVVEVECSCCWHDEDEAKEEEEV